MKPMLPALQAIGLLTLSNVFMTFAWYAHLKTLNDKPWFVAAVFVPFLMLFMRQPFRLYFVWAGCCMLGAVYFMFRGHS